MTVRVAFVCVQNAGRSQMSAAFAERERADRGLEDAVEIVTGGTHPAEEVHPEVVEVMDEVGLDLGGLAPREISTAELESCDVVATMGCSTLDLDAGDGADVDGRSGPDVRDWALDDPHGRDLDEVRTVRDEIGERVAALFDDVENRVDRGPSEPSYGSGI